jgi:hypothetical protein
MLAVICAADPDGTAWLEKQIIAGKKRWKGPHRRLANQEEPLRTHQDAGGHAGALLKGGEGVS